MQTDRFTLMSSNILGRIDELGTRIDELEKQIEDMMVQSSPNEGSPSKMGQH
jgi:heat shock factor-binding protein 1